MKSKNCNKLHKKTGYCCSLAKGHEKCEKMRINKHMAIGDGGNIYVTWDC